MGSCARCAATAWVHARDERRDQKMIGKLVHRGVPAAEVTALLALPPEARDGATAAALAAARLREGERVLHAAPAALRGRLPARLSWHAADATVGADHFIGSFKGLASAYGVRIDTYPIPTVIERGAFAESLGDPETRRRLKLLWQHDPAAPIGKLTAVREMARGLEIEARVIDTAAGRDAMVALRAGVVTELSIGFDAVEWEIKREGQGAAAVEIRHLTKGVLWEASLVTWGANDRALVETVHRRPVLVADEVALVAAEAALLDSELHEAEHALRSLEVETLAVETEAHARALGLVPAAEVRPDPTTPLGTAMLVREREQRDEFVASLGRDTNAAIYRESGRRRR